MNVLAQMLAAQKAKREGQAEHAGVGQANDSPSDPKSVAPVESAPARPAAKLGFMSGAKPTPKPAPTPAPAPATQPVSLDDVADGVISLDDLGATEDMGIGATRTQPHESKYAAMFADEIAATAPTRELPDDLSANQLTFVQSLDGIYEIVHDPELFGQSIRSIMQELAENPDYIRIMADSDVSTMIRGLRASMGLARIKKVERQSKTRGSKKAAAPTALSAAADEMDGW